MVSCLPSYQLLIVYDFTCSFSWRPAPFASLNILKIPLHLSAPYKIHPGNIWAQAFSKTFFSLKHWNVSCLVKNKVQQSSPIHSPSIHTSPFPTTDACQAIFSMLFLPHTIHLLQTCFPHSSFSNLLAKYNTYCEKAVLCVSVFVWYVCTSIFHCRWKCVCFIFFYSACSLKGEWPHKLFPFS